MSGALYQIAPELRMIKNPALKDGFNKRNKIEMFASPDITE